MGKIKGTFERQDMGSTGKLESKGVQKKKERNNRTHISKGNGIHSYVVGTSIIFLQIGSTVTDRAP